MRKRSSRKSLIAVMVPLSLLVIVITVLIQASMYSYFVKIYSDALCDVESDVLKQKSNNLLYLTENIKSLNNEVRLNDIVMQLCYKRELNTPELIQAQNQLDTVRISSSLVQSIYLINKNTREVHVTMDKGNRLYSFDDFYDQEIFEYMGNIKSYGTYTPVARELSMPDGKTMPVLTYYLYDYFLESEKMDGIILINIPIGWLEKKIDAKEAGYYQEGNDLIVVDEMSRVILSTGGLPFGESLESNGFVERILSSEADKGNFQQEIGGARYLISYYKYSNMDWNFIGVKSYSSIEEQLRPIRVFTVVAGLFIFCGGMAGVWLLSRQIAGTYQRMTDDMEKLEQENKIHAFARKNDFIRGLLKGSTRIGRKEMENQYQKYAMQTKPFDSYFVALFEIDRFMAFCKAYNLDERIQLMNAAANILKDSFGSYYVTDSAVISENQIVLLCNVKEVSEIIQISGTVQEIVKQVNRKIQDNQMVGFSCALSSVGDSCLELDALYEEVVTSIQYRYIMGYKSFLFPDILPEKSHSYDVVNGKQMVNDIINAVGKGKLDDVDRLLGEYLESIDSAFPYEIKILIINIVIQLNNKVPEMEVPVDIEDFSMERLIQDVLNTETIEETKQVVLKICHEISRLAEERKKGKYDLLIREIKEYIAVHAPEENMSINLIAENAGLSIGYLGRIFKKAEGVSVSEYIMQVRLERAVELLRDSEISINSIANQVGFLNNSYFYYIFKKNFNMTPNQWRTMELDRKNIQE